MWDQLRVDQGKKWYLMLFGRVNYPIMACLVAMQERQDVDLDCPHQCYRISWFTIRVADVGTALAVQSWNNHPILGKQGA